MTESKDPVAIQFGELKRWMHHEWNTGEELAHEFLAHILSEVREHFRRSPETNFAVVSMRHPELARVETVTIIIRREEVFCRDSDRIHKLSMPRGK